VLLTSGAEVFQIKETMDSYTCERWYAIHAKTRQEDLAALNLGRMNLEVLNPKIKREMPVWGQKRSVIKPLFPGYLFARFDPAKYLHLIQYARGIRQVLRCGTALLPVDDQIIQSICERLDSDGCVETPVEPLVPGSAVTIQDGPLSGLRGVFERDTSDRRRVVILLEAMQSRLRLEIERQALKPVA